MTNRYETLENIWKATVNKYYLRFNKEMITVKALVTHALVT